MTKLLQMPASLANKSQVEIFDDFTWFVTAHNWTSVLTDSGTATVGDAARGILAIACSDGTVADNDEGYVKTTAECFLFANDCPILFETRIQYTEANTDDANVAVGLSNAVAANTIVDNGAGLKTSGDMLCIFKVDGGTVWKTMYSKGNTQVVNTTTSTAGGSAYQTLRIEWRPVTSTFAEAHFFLDTQPLIDATSLKPIVYRFDYSSSPTEMNAFVGAKNGDTNMETLNVDYICAVQRRS